MADSTHNRYEPHAIEARRQAAWRAREAFRTPPLAASSPGGEERAHLYIKPSAPFTSGNVHIGHVRSYSIGDAYARFRRARGEDVLFAFGFDAFGLPAELGAIAGGESPKEWVDRCAAHMTGQLQRLGFSFDWERSFMSSDPVMYRWSQWLFLTLLDAGLIYRGTGNVNWCDNCQTTLASIQVEAGGTCWRCHGPVRLIQLPQWYLRISAYLEENDRRLGERAASGKWDEVALASQQIVLGRVERGGARHGLRRGSRADGVHAPCRGAPAGALRADVRPPPRRGRVGGRRRRARGARGAALRRLGAERAGGGDDPGDRHRAYAVASGRRAAPAVHLPPGRLAVRRDGRARHPRRGPHRRGDRAQDGPRAGGRGGGDGRLRSFPGRHDRRCATRPPTG